MVFTRNQKRKLNDDSENEGTSKINEIKEDTETEEDDTEDTTEYYEGVSKKKIEKILNNVMQFNLTFDKKYKDEYTKFKNNLRSIYGGEFFERSPVEENKNELKTMYTENDLKFFNQELDKIKEHYKKNAPSIFDILKLNISTEEKQKLLEKLHLFANSEVLSADYNQNLKTLLDNSNNKYTPELLDLEYKIKEINNNVEDSYRYKILTSKMSLHNKTIAYKKLEIMESYSETDSSEYAKYKTWLDTLLSIPFDTINPLPIDTNETPSDYLKRVRKILDENISFLEKPKDQILNIITNIIKNENAPSINAIGIHGNPGTGKCHGRDTPIIMYDGSTKMVQNIRAGELLMGDDSTPRTVLSTTTGHDMLYKITNLCGDSYITNKEHILCLKCQVKKRITHDLQKKYYTVRWYDNLKVKFNTEIFSYKTSSRLQAKEKATTFLNNINEELITEISVENFLKLPHNIQKYLYGYKVPLDFQEQTLGIDPYVFGYITSSTYTSHLFTCGIPDVYKCNSYSNRLQLVAGILDGCGQISKDCYKIKYDKYKQKFNQQILFVIRSLGFLTCLDKEYIYIYGNNIPVRNLDQIKCKYTLEFPVQITSIGMGNYYGFELNGNHRYVLENFIVTHNTSIVSTLAQALGRPFKTISLGGESDTSNLTGHNFTYIGSMPGRIVEVLRESKAMNVVIMIDELDKISETPQGKEIIGTLIHLTDYTTNHKYNHDRYLAGIELDLSKILFVFTYNDANKLDKILADRLYKINVPNYSTKEKLEIVKNHIIPKCLDKFLYKSQDVILLDDTLEYIVSGDIGLRDIIRKIEIIISRINTLLLTNPEDNVIKLQYKQLYNQYRDLPVYIKREHVDILLNESIDINDTKSYMSFYI